MSTGFKQATVASGDVPATQTNFPVYVDLKRMNGGSSLSSADAASIRVYSDSAKTTELAREIVSVDEMHAKVSSLTNTFTIYVDWDGSRADYAATDTYGRNAVWADYAAVYHLEGNSNDSTANGINGSDTSITYGTSYGVLGGQGATFNGSSSLINLGTSATLNFATTSYTTSAWSQPRSSAALMGVLNKRDGSSPNAGHATGYDWISADKYSFIQRASSVNYELSSTVTTPLNSWYHHVSVYDSSATDAIIYVGATSNTLDTTGRASISNSKATYIGALQEASFTWNGYIDEVRFRASALSANWITTEYNNQSDESGFWGTWTDVGGGGGSPTPLRMLMGIGS
jgi:hypothetical protein